MIVIKHRTTGERRFVLSLNGEDMTVWQETTETVPTDIATRAYVTVNGALVPKPPVMPLFDYLRLWTPAEALAVEDTSDTELRYAFLLLRGLITVDLSVAEVQAGIARARTLGILTEARAARISAGLPPQ